MIDPRIAALAAALLTADGKMAERYDLFPLDLTDPARERFAAAILDEMKEAGWNLTPIPRPVTNEPPPRLMPTDTSLAYDTGFQDGLGEAGQRHADGVVACEAEIARLRRIEEAARGVVLAARKMTPEIGALNAALAQAREATE